MTTFTQAFQEEKEERDQVAATSIWIRIHAATPSTQSTGLNPVDGRDTADSDILVIARPAVRAVDIQSNKSP